MRCATRSRRGSSGRCVGAQPAAGLPQRPAPQAPRGCVVHGRALWVVGRAGQRRPRRGLQLRLLHGRRAAGRGGQGAGAAAARGPAAGAANGVRCCRERTSAAARLRGPRPPSRSSQGPVAASAGVSHRVERSCAPCGPQVDASSHPVPIRYVSQRFADGAQCVMTGAPRTAEVGQRGREGGRALRRWPQAPSGAGPLWQRERGGGVQRRDAPCGRPGRTPQVRYTCLPDTTDNVLVSAKEFPTCN
jgi:hypothetical protein